MPPGPFLSRLASGALCALALPLACAPPTHAADGASPCADAVVFEDRDGNGVRAPGERPLAGIRVSDGSHIVETGPDGRFHLPPGPDGRTVFAIKPAGYALRGRADGLPDFWRNVRRAPGPALKYGGMPVSEACADIALRAQSPSPARERDGLRVLVFADPQPKSMADVGYYAEDIVSPIVEQPAARIHGIGSTWAGQAADLGLSLGDIVDDDLSLYPAMKRETARLGVPWLHLAGNHDLDFDAADDAGSLSTFRHHYGPDTLAWEEPEANFVALDDVVYQPGTKGPGYIGGLREDQFAFLERYLAGADRGRLLVLAMHIPLFEPAGRDTFRDADRERLFALLRPFPKVLVLSAHNHTQQHVFHDARDGWRGAQPLHEYNVGAACGAFWSGVKDAQGIPDSTMADGTPNGYARLRVARDGGYRLSWHSARGLGGEAMRLHAPRVLRKGAYPAFGVFANVFMGRDDSRVEYRVDDGEWQPMKRIERADPWLLAQNARDDQADALRGYDRSPEAEPSPHLWRGRLPTDLALGAHAVEVRVFDRWQGEQRAVTHYRLENAAP